MKVLLVDVDGRSFPNLALMRISAWHKAQGDTVDWYMPNHLEGLSDEQKRKRGGRKKMSKLEDIVPPMGMCKAAAERFPEAWRRDFARSEWEQTALCWRTFNRGRRDEYTIVFFTGSLDYESGDVNAPTLAEILAALPDGMIMMDETKAWYAATDRGAAEGITVERDSTPETAAMRLWINVQEGAR